MACLRRVNREGGLTNPCRAAELGRQGKTTENTGVPENGGIPALFQAFPVRFGTVDTSPCGQGNFALHAGFVFFLRR